MLNPTVDQGEVWGWHGISLQKKDALKEQSKKVKALELEKTEDNLAIATHEATIQDLGSCIDSAEATLLQLRQELSHVRLVHDNA